MSVTNRGLPTYHHTQRGPWWLLLYTIAALLLWLSWRTRGDPTPTIFFAILSALMFVLGTSIWHLTVADDGSQLMIRFGPLRLFQKRVWYDDIRGVEQQRSSFLDGWGIHWNPWQGWIWNIWGYDCVFIQLASSRFRVGTDDAERLVAFLRSRISENP